MKKYRNFNSNQNFSNRRPRVWSPPPHMDIYDRSVWLMNSFTGRVVVKRDNETVDNMLRRFKRSVESSGVLRELKKREFYLSTSQKRREKKKRALKRLRKRLKIEAEMMNRDDKFDHFVRDR